MKCPVCTSVDLLLAERQGIEIDYCPTCRGVWLDRGELDKIIDRANSQPAERSPAESKPYHHPSEQPPSRVNHGSTGYREREGAGYGHAPHYKKKKSLLSEIFDFD